MITAYSMKQKINDRKQLVKLNLVISPKRTHYFDKRWHLTNHGCGSCIAVLILKEKLQDKQHRLKLGQASLKPALQYKVATYQPMLGTPGYMVESFAARYINISPIRSL